jgi:hypothetical protein
MSRGVKMQKDENLTLKKQLLRCYSKINWHQDGDPFECSDICTQTWGIVLQDGLGERKVCPILVIKQIPSRLVNCKTE